MSDYLPAGRQVVIISRQNERDYNDLPAMREKRDYRD
jgi:hypothetical protein